MNSDAMIIERIDDIIRCTLNIPERMNALCEAYEKPIERLYDMLLDDTIKVIIIRGQGGNFCSGPDIKLLGENMKPDHLSILLSKMNAFVVKLREGPWPVITEVDGVAFGGGLGLALSSDITYATQRANFCMGFLGLGAIPDLGVSYFLTERVGLAKARELAFTGEILNAEDALSCGMIHKIIDHESISEKVLSLAKKIARSPKPTLTYTKRNLNRVSKLDLQTVLDLEAHIQPILLMSEAHKKAIKKMFPDMG